MINLTRYHEEKTEKTSKLQNVELVRHSGGHGATLKWNLMPRKELIPVSRAGGEKVI